MSLVQRVASRLLLATAVLVATPIATADGTADAELVRHLAASLASRTTQPDSYDTEVWLHWATAKLARVLPDAQDRSALLGAVYLEAHRHRLDPELLLAVIDVESRFDRFAVSRAGAQGVMQVMPFWKHEIGRPADNLLKVDTNLRYGAAILAHYLERSRGDLVRALARYNGSSGRADYPERVLHAWRNRWQSRPSHEIPALVASCARHRLQACASN